MRNALGVVAALTLWLFSVALWALRYMLFAVLMFLRPLWVLVFSWTAGLSLAALVLGLLIAREKYQMLWGFFGVGVTSTVFLFCYDALVLALPPGRFPMLVAR